MLGLNERLNNLKEELKNRKARIMIIGLGSVGCYLLDYLVSSQNENIEICAVGRNEEKMNSDINIVKVAALIRGQNRSRISAICNCDLNNIDDIAKAIADYQPDIIVNSSRAYSGLKYGTISWANIRAYGLWSPLAIKYIKNIMEAYEQAESNAIVINTSYSDAVIPWLKSAGKAYPDFGSGNINHLIPRFKLAVANELQIEDFWNIDVTFAVAHFHDVVISKEGQTEGVDMLIDIRYQDQKLDVDMNRILPQCSIAMPTDSKRNMMNASSNFEIIEAVLGAAAGGRKTKLHCPGVFGEIGGYPVIIDGSQDDIKAYIYQDRFGLDEMRKKNRESIYLDGIEEIKDGVLIYTDELIAKVKKAFSVDLMKTVSFDDIEETADFIIDEIIKKQLRS